MELGVVSTGLGMGRKGPGSYRIADAVSILSVAFKGAAHTSSSRKQPRLPMAPT